MIPGGVVPVLWRSRVLMSFQDRRGRKWSSGLAGVVAVVLAATLSPVLEPDPRGVAAAPPSVTAAEPPAAPPCPDGRLDVTSAAVAAKLCAGPVEVLGLRSETTQTFANADGSLTQEQHLAPVRIRRGEAWVPVDMTLERLPDGGVAAKAHPQGLRLSGPQQSEVSMMWSRSGMAMTR